MITIVTFKWKKPKKTTTGFKLKNPVEYSSEHVNVLYKSIKRNTTIPFKFICITDDPTGLDKDINFYPLWDTYRELGGCYTRLFMFSPEAKELFGDRIVWIDLDSVIVGNIDNILSRTEDFIINRYYPNKFNQIYNGALIMFNAGQFTKLWHNFLPSKSIEELCIAREKDDLKGSDQAWIQYILGKDCATFEPADGVYNYKNVNNDLPNNAKIIFFHGKDDPSIEKDKVDWIKEHWSTK